MGVLRYLRLIANLTITRDQAPIPVIDPCLDIHNVAPVLDLGISHTPTINVAHLTAAEGTHFNV